MNAYYVRWMLVFPQQKFLWVHIRKYSAASRRVTPYGFRVLGGRIIRCLHKVHYVGVHLGYKVIFDVCIEQIAGSFTVGSDRTFLLKIIRLRMVVQCAHCVQCQQGAS